MDLAIIYQRIRRLSNEIEAELKRLNRWQDIPLPESKFENMGKYGRNTLTVEQWIQFVFLPGLYQAIEKKEEFITESTVAAYALHALSRDERSTHLIKLLAYLDDAINLNLGPGIEVKTGLPILTSINNLPLPREFYDVAMTLPNFEGEALEIQLKAFDIFIATADTFERELIVGMLFSASDEATPANKRLRIRKAAISVGKGGNTRLS